MEKVFLSHFKSILPPLRTDQESLDKWILSNHKLSAELMGESADWDKLQKYFIAPESIAFRNSFCEDIRKEPELRDLYKITKETPKGVDIQKRADYFQEKSLQCFEILYPAHQKLPDHLVHVTCTGYISPSAPQRHFAQRKDSLAITHAYHMGCYAALPALRMSYSFVKSNEFKNVDVVHTEMCSLHMATHLHTAEQLIVQSLFADGVIKYNISSEMPSNGFEVLLIHEKLVPDSAKDMTWIPSANGMMMSLTRDVPTKIAHGLGLFIEEICQKLNIEWETLKDNSLFAIHPGGPKILDFAADLLMAETEQLQASREILKEHGNMSSATLPHIWERMLQKPRSKEYVLSLAFGPGLTIIGSVMRRVS
jgi:predicted naringenin-chalcone synthase